jgi:hypothetical protein
MAWTTIRSGPYIENLSQFMAPTIDTDGAYLSSIPLDDEALPFIYPKDFGAYVLYTRKYRTSNNLMAWTGLRRLNTCTRCFL